MGSAVSLPADRGGDRREDQTIIVNTGTDEVEGSTITFRIQGDTLVLSEQEIVAWDGASPPQAGDTLTLVRVE